MFEDLFAGTELDVLVPESEPQLPSTGPESCSAGWDADEWLASLQRLDRKQAFFDEHLQMLLTLRMPHISDVEPANEIEPPRHILSFLTQLQVSLEVSYIPTAPAAQDAVSPNITRDNSPNPSGLGPTPRSASTRFTVTTPPLSGGASSPPPRTASLKKPANLNLSLSPNTHGNPGRLSPNPNAHPSILPPATPNPTPATAAVDRRYVQAEGVVLTTKIWGQGDKGKVAGNTDEKDKLLSTVEKGDQAQVQGTERETTDSFNLFWSKKEKAWVAVYKMVFDVAFLRLPFTSPLLCLTLSATLRDKPPSLSSSSPLATYITSLGLGGLSTPASPLSPSSPQTAQQETQLPEAEEDILTGPPELNLLEGLYAGPTFAPPSALHFAKHHPTSSPGSRSAASSPITASSQTSQLMIDDEGALNLPSTRLGSKTRSALFSLPPVQPDSPMSSALVTPSPLPGQLSVLPSGFGAGKGHVRQATQGRGKAVLRKSFRKTLRTTSGLRVRMRTVFVPAMLLEGEDEGYGGSEEEEEDLKDVNLDDQKDDASERQGDGSDDETSSDEDEDEDNEQDPDRLTSGASERTVVLCVEIENEGELAEYRNLVQPPGFLVEKVDVSITGSAGRGDDGATATLVRWCPTRDNVDAAAKTFQRKGRGKKSSQGGTGKFPLHLASHEQHNLLYAVTFLRSPAEEALDGVGALLNPNLLTGVGVNSLPSAGVGVGGASGLQSPGADKALQRAVTINIFGKPYFLSSESRSIAHSDVTTKDLNYPTTTFSSRWNCVLDLSLSQHHHLQNYDEEYGEPTPVGGIQTGNARNNNNVLPEPASPFPVSVSFSNSSFPSLPPSSTYPSFASIISPRDRRSLGLDLGSTSGGGSTASSPGRRFSLGVGFPSVSGAATAGMAEKRHTLPKLPGLSGVPARVRSAGAGFPGTNGSGGIGGITQRPASALGGVRDKRESLGVSSARERRDSLPTSVASSGAGYATGTKYAPPSVSMMAAVQQGHLRSPTTYEAPPPPPFKDYPHSATIGGNGGTVRSGGLSVAIPSIDQSISLAGGLVEGAGMIPPVTPAYPAYPTNANTSPAGMQPPTPSQGPIIPHGGNMPPNSASSSGAGYVGPSVEVRRERGISGVTYDPNGIANTPVPPTPGPIVSMAGQGGADTAFDENHDRDEDGETNGAQSIVVSVGILPTTSNTSTFPPTSLHQQNANSELIYPLSTFTLDIFVFNRSGWTRRFEVSCPDERSRRKRRELASQQSNRQHPRSSLDWTKGYTAPGVLPLENRVRVGPLLPSACQSVRMKFLAVTPGVHSIDTLTLTDVESGFSMNLRSVIDVVVHEPPT